MNSNMKNSPIDELELPVKLYQETGDSVFLDLIMNQYKGHIQGRAYKASKQFGLDIEDCESTLMVSLWKSVEKFDPEAGVEFTKFVNVGFNKHLTWLFGKENRDNHFFGPCTKSDYFEEVAIKNKSFQMLHFDGGLSKYYQSDFVETLEWDLYDPRADVENLICEQDAARSLMEDIKKVDEVSGDVAALVATGHDYREVAKIMGYIPEGTSQRTAQINWVSRRLKKCIPPTERHYKLMGVQIPIKMRA